MTSNLQATEDVMRRKAYELLCFVLAKYDFPVLKNPINEYWCPIIDIQNNEDEILHESLISFAALMRVNEDLIDPETDVIDNNSVGLVSTKGESKPLTRKQACNKIIHSVNIEWKLNYSEQHPIYEGLYDADIYKIPMSGKYRNPSISLEGELHGESWTAEVSLLKLICEFNQNA